PPEPEAPARVPHRGLTRDNRVTKKRSFRPMIELLEDRLTPSLDSPIDVDSAPNIVDENAAVDSVVGITAYSANPDPEQGDVAYALAPGSPFVIDSDTGIVTVGSSGVDYESSGGSYTIQIYAYHGADSSNQTFTIYVNNLAPSAPEDVWTAPNAVDENTAGGALVGISLGNSADPAGGSVTYVLSDTAGGRFTLDFDNRIIVADGADLDYESSGGHYTVKAKAYDGELYSAETTFTINIGNVGEGSISGRIWYDTDLDGIQDAGEPGVANERVFLWLDENNYVEADTASGGYTFTGIADGSYTIQFYTSGSLYQDSFTYTVSDGIDTADATVTIIVNGAPSFSGLSNQNVNEGDTLNLSFTVNDPDVPPQALTLQVNWGDGSPVETFTVAPGDNVTLPHVYVDDNPTATPQDNYTISLCLDDGLGGTASQSVTATVHNVAPTAILITDYWQSPTDPVTVGFEDIVDPGTSDTFTFSFDWNGDGDFDDEDEGPGSSPYRSHIFEEEGEY